MSCSRDHERACDNKGRVMIPPVIRKQYGGSFRFKRAQGPSLLLEPCTHAEGDTIKLDHQGRIRICSLYLKWLGIKPRERDRVVIFPNGANLKICSVPVYLGASNIEDIGR